MTKPSNVLHIPLVLEPNDHHHENVMALYVDGGMLSGGLPSPLGGTWACCMTDSSDDFLWGTSGVITAVGQPAPLPSTCPLSHWEEMPYDSVENNLSEFYALVRGLEYLPDGFNGHIYSDSQNTLARAFKQFNKSRQGVVSVVDGGWKMNGLPTALIRHCIDAVARLGPDAQAHLLDGHPTKAQLEAGRGKRGGIVSMWNKWADDSCNARRSSYEKEIEAFKASLDSFK